MARLPSIEELELEVLRIYGQFGCRPADVLQINNLHAKWFKHPNKYTGEDLGAALDSLLKKGFLEKTDSQISWRLTEAGFEEMPG